MNDDEGIQSLGPAGGSGDHDWSTMTVPAGCRIRSITFKVGDYVDQVRVVYEDADGKPHETEGGGPGGKEWLEPLEIPNGVQIVGITVRSGRVVDSVTVHLSNGDKRTFSGTKAQGNKSEVLMLPKRGGKYVGKVVGFFGTRGDKMDSIGIRYEVGG